MADYTHLNYRIQPNFKIGKPDQWYEEGYFYVKGKFFFYSDDRHDSIYKVELIANSKQDFKSFCRNKNIEIPLTFWGQIKRMQ